MACEAENIRAGGKAAPTSAGELKLLADALHSLPADAVKELFSIGVRPPYITIVLILVLTFFIFLVVKVFWL